MKRLLLVTSLIALLTACGFQLRGQYQLPETMQRVVIDAPKLSDFADILADRLRLAGASVVTQDGTLLLTVENDALTRRTLSLSASGQVAEYELIYTVNYMIRQPQKEAESLQVEVYRDYQDDPNFALAKTREREVLVREMREQAAQQVVRQLIAAVAEE